ncbi:MAG: CPBP family intramembrane metalloprotease [Treponema sp.]|nr:CPBP family intramembrane metalloprotease [Treponema sp.]
MIAQMKKKYILIQLCAVLILLVLPTLTVSSSGQMSAIFSFSFFSLVQLFLALILDAEWRIFLNPREVPARKNFFSVILNHLQWTSITIGLLMFTYAAITVLSLFLSQLLSHSEQNLQNISPGITNILFLIINVFCASYYEEVIYRQTIPESLLSFTENKYIKILFELLTLMLFALGHLYLGIAAVANAFICGIFLRLCRIKTGSVSSGTAAHFIYNMTLFIFILLS